MQQALIPRVASVRTQGVGVRQAQGLELVVRERVPDVTVVAMGEPAVGQPVFNDTLRLPPSAKAVEVL